jgi:hypothetical protein
MIHYPPPPIKASPSLLMASAVEPRTRFRRTVLIVASHWILQAIICAIAQYDIRKLSELCIFLISADSFIHIILLSSFAGMVFRSRFLFSWAFGFALLSFGISFALGYLAVNFQYRGWFGPEFVLYILHFFIACACGICLVFWPIVGWKFELTRNTDHQTAINGDQLRFQFSMVWLFYLTLTVALLSFGISQMYDGVLSRGVGDDAVGWWLVARGILCFGLVSQYCNVFYVKVVSLLDFASQHLRLDFPALFFFLTSLPTSEVGFRNEAFQLTLGFLGMTFYLYLNALAYRWAGWRLVRFAGHNKSVYKRIYRYIMSSH